jgi:hypothetical protein
MITNPGEPWPKYSVVSADPTYGNGKMNSKGYACLRNNYNWAFPQDIDGTNKIVKTSTAIRTFYASTAAHLGPSPTAEDATATINDDTTCCPSSALTYTGCAVASFQDSGNSNVDTPIPERMLWGITTPNTAPWALTG